MPEIQHSQNIAEALSGANGIQTPGFNCLAGVVWAWQRDDDRPVRTTSKRRKRAE